MAAFRIGVIPTYAALCAFAVDALYIVLISKQGDGLASRVFFVAASLALAGVAVLAAEAMCDFPSGLAAAWASATLWVWVLLGAFSIGILVIPAAILSTIALTRRRRPPVAIAAGIALALVTAVAGLAWTG